MTGRYRIKGHILLPSETSLRRALMIVRVMDVRAVDAPAIVFGELERWLDEECVVRIPYELDFDIPADLRQIGVAAEVRLTRAEALSAGDYLSVRATRLARDDIVAGRPVDFPVAIVA